MLSNCPRAASSGRAQRSQSG